jgi:hypothetical protein
MEKTGVIVDEVNLTLTISLPLETIRDIVHSRTYYIGESFKRKDIDYVSVQTSSDDIAELGEYVDTALNELCGKLVKRAKTIDWDEITNPNTHEKEFTVTLTPYKRFPNNAKHVFLLLRKAMLDYITTYVIYQWLITVKPELAATFYNQLPELMWKCETHVAQISGIIRRRATNLAGI